MAETERPGAAFSPRQALSLTLIVGGIGIVALGFLAPSNVYVALGISVSLIGALGLLLVPGTAYPPELLEELSKTSMQNIQSLIREFEASGLGIYIPTSGKEKTPKIFVPFARSNRSARPDPSLVDYQTILVTAHGEEETRGLLITPSGAGIFGLIERELSIDFSEVQPSRLEDALSEALSTFDLASKVRLSIERDVAVAEMDPASLSKIEHAMTEAFPDASSRVGTLIVSIIGCALAKSTQKYVEIREVGWRGRREYAAFRIF